MTKRTVVQPYKRYDYYCCSTYKKLHSKACTKHAVRAELFRAQQTAAPESGVVSEAVELIRREYARPLTVDELAGQVGLSPSQFSRRFKRQTGASPYAYLLGVRLAKAKELLKNTSLPVGEIAFRAGFANESNFIYYFKKQEGMPPLRFRSAIF